MSATLEKTDRGIVRLLALFVAGLLCCFGRVAAADETTPMPASPNAAQLDFFEKKIRPVLVEHCYKCHSTQSKKPKGGLLLDSRQAMLQGGDSGPSIVPGKPGESLLIEALRYRDDSYNMPPQGKLPAGVIADFVAWVKSGAADPRIRQNKPESSPNKSLGIDTEKPWAFLPLRKPPLPSVSESSWPRGDIDRFVLARLQEKGLTPVADAARRTLIRRLTFDLTGLPPVPEEIDAFLADRSPDATSRLVDRLLASPRFGEHWGRHWLDLARYADSNGSDINLTYHNAWRYRDYVIDSLNQDRPFDTFIVEQIAGDLLPSESDKQRRRQLVATGFLIVGPKMLSERDKEKLRMDVVDEQIDTIGRVFLGLTLGCARCHDHKFDPVPMKDYYALAGILRSTETVHGIRMGNVNVSGWLERDLPPSPEEEKALAAHQEHIDKLSEKLEEARTEVARLKEQAAAPPTEQQAAQLADATMVVKNLQAELAELKKNPPVQPPRAMAVRDREEPADCELRVRGDPRNLGATVPRGFIAAMGLDARPNIPDDTSGRLELARWIADSSNPLTARVIVNRLWHHLFGAGLVRSVDNFGQLGQSPSHPKLLDYLAVDFLEHGWSIKHTIRKIVMSRTYQLASVHDARSELVDAENRLLWRHNRRRLTGEAIRDAMLVFSGQMDFTAGGSSVATLGESAINNSSSQSGGVASAAINRRSVFLPLVRNDLPELLTAFDFADPDVVTGRRPVTTVPAQALLLLNSPSVRRRAEFAAQRLLTAPSSDDARRVDLAYQRALGRGPTDTERSRILEFLSAADDSATIESEKPSPGRLAVWTSFCQMLIASAEFRFVD